MSPVLTRVGFVLCCFHPFRSVCVACYCTVALFGHPCKLYDKVLTQTPCTVHVAIHVYWCRWTRQFTCVIRSASLRFVLEFLVWWWLNFNVEISLLWSSNNTAQSFIPSHSFPPVNRNPQFVRVFLHLNVNFVFVVCWHQELNASGSATKEVLARYIVLWSEWPRIYCFASSGMSSGLRCSCKIISLSICDGISSR